MAETPPLTRRKLGVARDQSERTGNTSAYAEKTNRAHPLEVSERKHLRLRGENSGEAFKSSVFGETPPLTRRKLDENSFLKAFLGNTSAYAEKTS